MNWVDKVALATLVIAAIILMAFIRLAIRLGGI